jgi:hypothetical protein
MDDNNMYEKMKSYHLDMEANHPATIIASKPTNMNSHVNSSKQSPKNNVDLLKKQQQFYFESKITNKQVELQYDNDLQKFHNENDNNYEDESDSEVSYVEVEVEEEELYTKPINDNSGLDSKIYSKTYDSQLTSPQPIIKKQQEKIQELKPCLKSTKNSKIKRFRSPRATIEKLESTNEPQNLQHQRDAYKRMRRRSGRVEPHPVENKDDNEDLKQEYIKLKQQLLELENLKTKSKKVKIEKSQRNHPQNDKKVTINPHKERQNSKYVRFNVDEKAKRGKTPIYMKGRGKVKEFYFSDESNDSADELSNNKDKDRIKEISMQYNHNRHSNSLLI